MPTCMLGEMRMGMAETDGVGGKALEQSGRVGTLGMLIIDQYEVCTDTGERVVLDEESIGGGGVFAICAARHFLPPSKCALIIDQGPDLSSNMVRELATWGGEGMWFRPRDDGTTRAVNVYSGSEVGAGHQTFRYTHPSKQIFLHDLIDPPSPFTSDVPTLEWVHVVVRLPRARAVVDEAKQLKLDRRDERELRMVWEPLDVQPMGSEEELLDWLQVARGFSIVSPNYLEAVTILGGIRGPVDDGEGGGDSESGAMPIEHVRIVARALYSRLAGNIDMDNTASAVPDTRPTNRSESHTPLPLPPSKSPKHPSVVVRAGKLGSYAIWPGGEAFTPAYWRETDQGRVRDTTGGGNAFLGGICAGLMLSGGDLQRACSYASVSASFAIEQRGLPRFTVTPTGEKWNDDDPLRRLAELDGRSTSA